MTIQISFTQVLIILGLLLLVVVGVTASILLMNKTSENKELTEKVTVLEGEAEHYVGRIDYLESEVAKLESHKEGRQAAQDAEIESAILKYDVLVDEWMECLGSRSYILGNGSMSRVLADAVLFNRSTGKGDVKFSLSDYGLLGKDRIDRSKGKLALPVDASKLHLTPDVRPAYSTRIISDISKGSYGPEAQVALLNSDMDVVSNLVKRCWAAVQIDESR